MSVLVTPDTQLVSPVKFDDGGGKRYGVLYGGTDRIRLVTSRGVELDAERSELVGAQATTSMPRVRFTYAGRPYDLRLIGPAKSHDTNALEVDAERLPGYAQQDRAVGEWHRWFNPATPEQITSSARAAAERRAEERFEAEQLLGGPVLQTPAWDTATGRTLQLRLANDVLTVTRPDGETVVFGAAEQVDASFTGRGATSQLHLRAAGVQLSLAFRRPPVRGGGGSAWGDPDGAVIWLLLFPVALTLICLDRRSIRRRARAWRTGLSPKGKP